MYSRSAASLLGLVLLAGLVLVPIAAGATGSHRVDGALDAGVFGVGDRSLASINVASSEAVARVELSAPSGYPIDLDAPPGTVVGFASTLLSDVSGTSSSFAADNLVAQDPARHVGTPESESCAPGRHDAVWSATFSVLGQTYALAIYVDRKVAGNASSGAVLRFCPLWRPAGVPSGITAARLSFFLEDVVQAPEATGRYVWSALVTPPLPSLAPDPSHTFEVRAVDVVPHTLTLRTRHDAKRKTAVVTGTLTAEGAPEAGVEVVISATTASGSFGSDVARVTTNASGAFSVTRPVSETTAFVASAELPSGACSGPSAAPAGCVRETYTPPSSASSILRVRRATDPKLVPRARDQATARRGALALGDFPPGWVAYESFSPFECRAFRPSLSKLTATGEAESKVFATAGEGAASRTTVFISEAEARTAFARLATSGLVRCFADEYKGDDGVRILQVGSTPFPRLGTETRAFRLVLADGEDVVSEDYVYIRKGRTAVQLVFASYAQPFVGADAYARKVVARVRA